MKKSATVTSFSPSIRVCPVSIIPPYVHTLPHPHLHVTVKRMTNGRSLGTFQKTILSRQLETTGWKSNFTDSLKLRCHQYNSQQICWYT
jgi:hypothetical protein